MKLYERVSNVSFDNVILGMNVCWPKKMVVEGKLAIGGFYLHYPLQGLVCRHPPKDIVLSLVSSYYFLIRMPVDNSFLFMFFIFIYFNYLFIYVFLFIYSICLFIYCSRFTHPFPLPSKI